MSQFSKRTQNLNASKTMHIAKLCRQKVSKGHDVVAMNIGDSDLVTPLSIQAAAIEAIHAGHNKYTDTRGIIGLREAIKDRVNKEHDMTLDADDVLATPGLKQAIFYAIMSTIEPGDEVIIPAPYWPSFVDIVEYAGGVPVVLPSSIDNEFDVTAHDIEHAITEKTRMVILTSPNNPTGRAISRKLLSSYGAVLSKYPNIWIMCDYIYQYIYWGEEPLAYIGEVCPHLHKQLIILGGFSKTYAISGWRLGYICSQNHELMSHMQKLQEQTVCHPNSIAQHAALEALNHDSDIHQDAKTSFKARHDFLYHALNQLPGVEVKPTDGAMYLFPKVTGLIRNLGLRNDEALAEYLLEHADISVTPGSYFGSEGYLRFSFAIRQERLDQGIKNLSKLSVFEKSV